MGGGISDSNAQTWLDRGAAKVAQGAYSSHLIQVIVSSWLFVGGKFSEERATKVSGYSPIV